MKDIGDISLADFSAAIVERDLLRSAFLRYVQTTDNDCKGTGEPCRNPDQCGCWLEMIGFIDYTRAIRTVVFPKRPDWQS
jgi:hypothetical protein